MKFCKESRCSNYVAQVCWPRCCAQLLGQGLPAALSPLVIRGEQSGSQEEGQGDGGLEAGGSLTVGGWERPTGEEVPRL